MKFYLLEIKVYSEIKPGKILKDVQAFYSKKEAMKEAKYMKKWNGYKSIKIIKVTPNEEVFVTR